MKPLEDYYTPDVPIQKDIHALSDPRLGFESHRGDVNELVLNIVIKYIAEYLRLPQQDVEMLKIGIREAGSPDKIDTLITVINGLAAMTGDSLPASEMLALECLCDVRATAAIFKEIAFNQRFAGNDSFVSMDLGSGSGVLMVASVIAARRREVRESMHVGFDTQVDAVTNSRRALMNTVMDDNTLIKVEPGDILRPNLWEIFNDIPLSHWVSETINHSTPPMRVTDDGGLKLQGGLEAQLEMRIDKYSDPFVAVVANAVKHRRSFVKDIQGERTAMFPDLMNGNLQLARMNTRLRLDTYLDSEGQKLHDVGEEFRGYEDFGLGGRWPDPSAYPEEEAALHALMNRVTDGGELLGFGRKKKKPHKKPNRSLQKNKRKRHRKERKKGKKKKG